MAICGIGMLLSMTLVAWGSTVSGTAASFGIYAIASSFGPTVIIDSIRTSLLHHGVFGTAYAVKILVNNRYVWPGPPSFTGLKLMIPV